jgi:AcrR family transcriptional regulator
MHVRAAKMPRQVRSQAHVEKLLDAAVTLIARHGVAGLTMAAVGKAAGSSPGSLYQFFPNREAIVDAVATREAARVTDCIDVALIEWTKAGALNAVGLVDALLPPLQAVYDANSAWGEILHALAHRGEPGATEKALDSEVMARLGVALQQLAPRATPTMVERAVQLILEIGHAGLVAARDDALTFAEVRRCLVAYTDAWCAANQ